MTINTRDFGEQEIAEDKIINFPNGIYAFEDQHRFVMLSPLGNDVFPAWLQSLDNENLCFIVCRKYLSFKLSGKIIFCLI
ncbi:MAG: flagellar assembly protein FliW, partial [Oscillospiraceae bacterium]|nr:flagellar assembly protein FliW [Oscillospiraceae bacterium]